MILNVICDLSEVIILGQWGIEKTIAEITGIDEKTVDQALISNIFDDLLVGKITEDYYSEEVIKTEKWNISVDFLKKITRENFHKEIEGTLEILIRLKENGLKLYLLSDHVKEWIDYILEYHKFLDIFDKKYFSYELGFTKKYKEAFEIVMKDLDIKTNETLFIDDSETNIRVAKNLGINGIIFKNAEQLEKELLELKLI